MFIENLLYIKPDVRPPSDKDGVIVTMDTEEQAF